MGILLGNGDGTFQAPVSFTAGIWPYSVAMGDFNADGKADLATANNSTGTITKISTLYNTISGSAVALPSGSHPTGLTVSPDKTKARTVLVQVEEWIYDGWPDVEITGSDISEV